MRLDDFLSSVGIIKRRTVAKDLGSRGMIEVNGKRAKPAYQLKINDIIVIKGANHAAFEVLAIPSGSVNREGRASYFRALPEL